MQLLFISRKKLFDIYASSVQQHNTHNFHYQLVARSLYMQG